MRRLTGHQRRAQRATVLERDNFTCVYCSVPVTTDVQHVNTARYATVDHVVPLSEGGALSIRNLVTACYACNQDKASKRLTPAARDAVLAASWRRHLAMQKRSA